MRSGFFTRLRERIGLDHLSFHDLRKFMETYGQEMGDPVTQVALRAGHDPVIAAKHDSGQVTARDRELANAVASLIAPPAVGAPGRQDGRGASVEGDG
jgi:integrase